MKCTNQPKTRKMSPALMWDTLEMQWLWKIKKKYNLTRIASRKYSQINSNWLHLYMYIWSKQGHNLFTHTFAWDSERTRFGCIYKVLCSKPRKAVVMSVHHGHCACCVVWFSCDSFKFPFQWSPENLKDLCRHCPTDFQWSLSERLEKKHIMTIICAAMFLFCCFLNKMCKPG